MLCLRISGKKDPENKTWKECTQGAIRDNSGYTICCNTCGKQTARMCHVIKHIEQVHINLCGMNKSIFTHISIDMALLGPCDIT